MKPGCTEVAVIGAHLSTSRIYLKHQADLLTENVELIMTRVGSTILIRQTLTASLANSETLVVLRHLELVINNYALDIDVLLHYYKNVD